MFDFTTLFPFQPFFMLPNDVLSIVGWFILMGILFFAIYKTWEPLSRSMTKKIALWVSLTILAVILPIIGGIKIEQSFVLPLPNLPNESTIPTLILFNAFAWELAAGFLGIFPAVILAIISSIVFGALDTHSIFTIVEVASMAFIFSYLVRQNFRTRLFRWARIPTIAAVFTSILAVPLVLLSQFLSVEGSFAIRFDYALTQFWQIVMVRGFELVIASIICNYFYFSHRSKWVRSRTLIPSPTERKIEIRFLVGTIPVILVVIFILIISSWFVAGNAATNMIETNLKSTAEITADSLPYFLDAGQNLLLHLAEPSLMNGSENLSATLSEKLRSVPFFRQLYVFNSDGDPLDGYPIRDIKQVRLTNEEVSGVQVALRGVSLQTYTAPPWPGEDTAQISFIVAIKDGEGKPIGVLFGRTDLNSNPFTQPAIEALYSATKNGGEGIILDEDKRILFHTVASSDILLNEYAGEIPEEASLFEDYTPQGTRQFVYYQPMVGRQWSVLVSAPATEAQQMALTIAFPLLIVLSILAVVMIAFLRFSIRPITNSVKNLSNQAKLIAQGNLNSPMPVKGVDEFGQLANAFEQMRLGLKDRLDELRNLLLASQGVAEHLKIQDAIKPVLQAAQTNDTLFVRVVLTKNVIPEHVNEPLYSIGIGEQSDGVLTLDKQMYEMLRYQNILLLPHYSRLRRLNTPAGMTPPGAVVGVALHHENEYYGVLWIAYRNPKSFTEEEVRFYSTLATQAAMAAANARLYTKAELGRERLEAVLKSTPEPVMVFDESDRLFLINQAALQLGGLLKTVEPNTPMDDLIENEELLSLLKNYASNRDTSREIQLSNNRFFYTTVSPVNTMDRMVGKVCILRDITHFKELDSLKSDIVATVSHDLRSPLTLMRGYATMLQMVGELNDQQRGYVGKIVGGVDSMSKLVNNLLDLGRIEAGIGLNVESVYPASIIEQVISQLQPQATQKNIKLSYHSEMLNDAKIEVDNALITQALFNLVENGIKYSSVNGKVEVFLAEKGDNILFEIQDHGVGIAPIDLPHLFDKFYRSGQRDSIRQRGTGLGLAIVKSIVDRHRGRIWVESKLGRGSSFFVELPKSQS